MSSKKGEFAQIIESKDTVGISESREPLEPMLPIISTQL
jgi:hypothetical protein